MSTHSLGFYEDLTKISFELSSNTHLISSADYRHISVSCNLHLYKAFKFNLRMLLILPML